MSKRILVPIEGNGRDAEALSMAISIAERIPSEVVLIHVAPAMFDTRDVVATEQRLDEYTQELRANGINAHFLMEYGKPSVEIAQAARQQDAEMIVVAPEQRAMLEVLWHRRVSSGLLERSTVPLLILPDIGSPLPTPELLYEPDARVILAVDGSENAEAALPIAIELARAYQRPLVLVRVVPPVFVLGAGVDAMRARHNAQYAEVAEAHQYLTETRQHIATETQIHVETVELVGPVVEQLVHLATSRTGSLLVMGTHGRGGVARAVVGSVAAGVMSHATTPLVIVPSHPEKSSP